MRALFSNTIYGKHAPFEIELCECNGMCENTLGLLGWQISSKLNMGRRSTPCLAIKSTNHSNNPCVFNTSFSSDHA